MSIKPLGNTDVSADHKGNQPQAASAVPETGTEVTGGALEGTNMGDGGSQAADTDKKDGDPAAAKESAQVAGKTGDNNDPKDKSLGKKKVTKAKEPKEAVKPAEAAQGNDAVAGADGNQQSRQASNLPDPTDQENTHPNKRVAREGGPLHDPEDNVGKLGKENLPRIYDKANIKALKEGQRFFAVFAHDPKSDDGRHVNDRIDDLRAGRISRHGIPVSYWGRDFKTRPPVGRKESGGFVIEG